MKEIRFDLPKGFAVPEGKAEGDRIDVLATLELESGGKACLKEIDGNAMPGYEGHDEEDKRSYPQAAADEMDAMMRQRSTGGY